MSAWRKEAAAVIREAHKTVPEGATLKERAAIIDAAYPFGPRQYHPYKMWLKERAEYLRAYGYRPKPRAIQETPLERLMRRGKRNDPA
jgi:hypothetical protein